MSDFLKELADKPTEKPRSIKKRVTTVLLSILIYLSIIILFVGVRNDIQEVIISTKFWIEMLVLFLILVLSVVLMVKLLTPGQEKKVGLKVLQGFFVLWAILNIFVIFEKPDFYSKGVESILNACFNEVFLVSMLPAFFLFFISFKRDVYYPQWLSSSILITSAGAAGLLLQLSCASDNPFHIMGSHYLPIMMIILLGGFVVKKVLKKK